MVMIDPEQLDDLGRRAVAEPPRPLPDLAPLERRARRRRVRRQTVRATAGVVAVAILAVAGGRLTASPDQDRSGGIAAIGATETTVDGVAGLPLGRDDAIWPAEPLPIDQLRAIVTTWLGWPSVDWEPTGPGQLPNGTGYHPEIADRRVVLNVDEVVGGYRVAFTYPDLKPVLDAEGRLIGARGVDFGPDTVRVELYRSDRTSQHEIVFTDPGDWADVLHLPAPVDPADAGSLLAVGRDSSGQATAVAGVALGLPNRLTVAIDRLTAASVPASLPRLAAEMVADDPLIDPAEARLVADVAPGVDLYLVPSRDRSRLLVVTFERDPEGGAGGSGADAATFNRAGIQTAWQFDDKKYTMYIVPDGITVGDLGRVGHVDPTGSVVVIEDQLLAPEAFEIVDGVLRLHQP